MKNITDVILKYPELHHRKEVLGLGVREFFECAPEKQQLFDIIINVESPFSQIIFDKQDTLLAVLCGEMKTSWGYAFAGDFKCFLNLHEINEILLSNIHLYAPLLEQKNIITIQHLENFNYTYFCQLMVYPLYQDIEKSKHFVASELLR
jgi:hypothetical protein